MAAGGRKCIGVAMKGHPAGAGPEEKGMPRPIPRSICRSRSCGTEIVAGTAEMFTAACSSSSRFAQPLFQEDTGAEPEGASESKLLLSYQCMEENDDRAAVRSEKH